MTDALTEMEHEAVTLLGRLAGLMGAIIGDEQEAYFDRIEMVHHVHVLQRMVLAQAAARAYPDRYRLMGHRIPPETGDQP